jgi:hypothetical protein
VQRSDISAYQTTVNVLASEISFSLSQDIDRGTNLKFDAEKKRFEL